MCNVQFCGNFNLFFYRAVPPGEDSPHTMPVGAGGAGLTSLEAHAWGGYLGASYRIAGPLQQRLTTMGGNTNRAIATSLQNPSASRNSHQWAHNVWEAREAGTKVEDRISIISQNRYMSR